MGAFEDVARELGIVFPETIENHGEYGEADYNLYVQTVDAIFHSKPERVTKNCMEMLYSKVRRIENSELRSHAFGEFRKLSEKIGDKDEKYFRGKGRQEDVRCDQDRLDRGGLLEQLF